LSEMEITFDPKWEAACAGLAIGEEHEVCPDGEWIRYARRLTGIKDLFVYHHKKAGSWVLAKWLFPPTSTDSPVALELEAMPLPPDMPGSGRLVGDSLISRCKPVDEMVDAMKARLRRASSHRKSMMDERIHSKKNAVKYMRRQGMDHGAHLLEEGMSSWAAPSECENQYNQTVNELMAMAKAT
jgi:hypothetical protein